MYTVDPALWGESMGDTKKILVIDDDEVACALISGILRTHKRYKIITGENGEDGIGKALRELPDLIILDIMMPRIDGYEVCKILREEMATRYIPIILLSAKGGVDSQVQGLELGADDYITKPFNHTELIARVEALIRRHELSLDANPLTRLPGNMSIERELIRRLADSCKFAVGYADMDNFKAFNDQYGFAMGDRIIFETGQIISHAVTQFDFVGHIGGDDFVFITTPDTVDKVCQTIIQQFDRILPRYYDEESRARGYIETKTRNGMIQRFPVMSLSIAVVTNLERNFTHFAEISTIGAELKRYLKTLDGSNYLIDRRKDDSTPDSGSPGGQDRAQDPSYEG
jgi:PleD family two-component response regulator